MTSTTDDEHDEGGQDSRDEQRCDTMGPAHAMGPSRPRPTHEGRRMRARRQRKRRTRVMHDTRGTTDDGHACGRDGWWGC